MTMRCLCLGLAFASAVACSANIGESESPAPGTPGSTKGPDGTPTPGTPSMQPRPGEPVPPGQGNTPIPTPSAPAASCTTPGPQAAPAPLRRLTRREYNNTVNALTGDTTGPSKDFVLDGEPRGFENNADSPITALSAVQYSEAAERLARAATLPAKMATLAPCVAGTPEDNCARQFVTTFGKRAYRRPLTAPEVERLFGVYKNARTILMMPFAEGIRVAMQTMLQSPHFLNHVEKGVPGAAPQNGLVPLTQYEIASRLSYFLWTSMPDTMLFAAADNNKLATPADIDAQVTRMLALPIARTGILYFFRQWLDLDKIDKTDKSTTAFPTWSSTKVKSFLRPEAEAFINDVLWTGDGKLTTLLTAPYAFVNSSLAPLYGVPDPGMGDTLVKTNLDPTQRAGIMTLVTNLAIQAHSDQTSPVHRGLFVREHLLCQSMPSPPGDVDVTVPKVDPRLTTRERFAKHSTDPYCAGCHRLIDPIGVGFENYDAIGRWRTTEAGKAVDATGEVFGSADVNGKFTSAVELAGKLSKSAAVRDCFSSQWLDYAVGVPMQDLSCAVAQVSSDFEKAGTDIKKLIYAVARSDAFRFRKAVTTDVCK